MTAHSIISHQPSAISKLPYCSISEHCNMPLQMIQLSFNLTKCSSNNFLVNHVTLNFCSATQLSMSWHTHTCSLSHLMCILTRINSTSVTSSPNLLPPPDFIFHFSQMAINSFHFISYHFISFHFIYSLRMLR